MPRISAEMTSANAAAPPRRILIVDDSIVARAVLGRMLKESGRFEVAGAVGGAAAAMAFVKANSVDVILLDIQMPGVDGLAALPDLLAASAGAKIVIVSSTCDDGAATTIKALALGAADTLVKPSVGTFAGRFAELLSDKLTRLFEVDEVAVSRRAAPSPRAAAGGFDIVAIGASTGGIHALSQLLQEIPPSFSLPILITQHLPESFMPYFAAQVAVMARRPCDVATDRMRIRPGRVIVAPGDGHLRCVSLGDGTAAVRLSRDPAASACMPSVDPMFDSVAEVFGARALAVVLSGMGRDGSDGARRVAAAGGCVIVQDRASSVVWGMPGVVAAAGGADAVLPPDAIGRLVATGRRPGC